MGLPWKMFRKIQFLDQILKDGFVSSTTTFNKQWHMLSLLLYKMWSKAGGLPLALRFCHRSRNPSDRYTKSRKYNLKEYRWFRYYIHNTSALWGDKYWVFQCRQGCRTEEPQLLSMDRSKAISSTESGCSCAQLQEYPWFRKIKCFSW